MKYFTPFRIAAYLLVLYCLAHTAGGMLAQDSVGASGDAVFQQMKAVRFDFNGANSSWYGFWFGFGIMVSVFLGLSAFTAWQLDKAPASAWPSLKPIAWSLVAAQAVTTVLGFEYFFAGPGAFGVAITALLAVGAYRKDRAAAGVNARPASVCNELHNAG